MGQQRIPGGRAVAEALLSLDQGEGILSGDGKVRKTSYSHSLLHGCESKAPFPLGSSFSLLESSLPEDTPVIAAEVAAPVPSAILTRYLEFPDISEGGRPLAS